ncbi:MAG: metalloregulator ArsR/SmtB family transcription factor [Rhodobacteraceae bacterium]|nr:metalloregulator ArsR/SmtB family transcription factor [Paracoccaceae bacterium]
MDAIFKALNDPVRRAILDCLREKDGQTLQELEARFEMTRFGVMKHLKVLEDASLVVPRRQGRFKHHHLNALPLQEVIDRWIEPLLAKPAARGLIDLKGRLERTDTMTDQKPEFVMQTYIRCTRDALWDALRDADAVPHFHFMAARAERDGAKLTYFHENGEAMLVCEDLELDPKARMVQRFLPQGDPNVKPSRVVMMIDEEGPHCRLTVEHFDLTYGPEGVANGWSRTIDGLKTWLETGQDAHFRQPESVPA